MLDNLPRKTPISLIIDDGAPVDPLFYELPGYEIPFLVPTEFTKRVAEAFERFDLR
jgi:predicted ATP-dependent Lon-type protease